MLKGTIAQDTQDRFFVPIWLKTTLTIKEAAALSGIGEHSIREMIESGEANFYFRIGNKWMINRQLFDQFIMKECSK